MYQIVFVLSGRSYNKKGTKYRPFIITSGVVHFETAFPFSFLCRVHSQCKLLQTRDPFLTTYIIASSLSFRSTFSSQISLTLFSFPCARVSFHSFKIRIRRKNKKRFYRRTRTVFSCIFHIPITSDTDRFKRHT